MDDKLLNSFGMIISPLSNVLSVFSTKYSFFVSYRNSNPLVVSEVMSWMGPIPGDEWASSWVPWRASLRVTLEPSPSQKVPEARGLCRASREWVVEGEAPEKFSVRERAGLRAEKSSLEIPTPGRLEATKIKLEEGIWRQLLVLWLAYLVEKIIVCL